MDSLGYEYAIRITTDKPLPEHALSGIREMASVWLGTRGDTRFDGSTSYDVEVVTGDGE